ncbi:hypothetical protein Tco_1501913 [Tanacetum coccineum]
MNSMFSSFDALSAEFLSKSLRAFNTKAPSGASLKDEQTKVKHETSGSTVIRSSNKASSYGARWAPELDGLHCFEFMILKTTSCVITSLYNAVVRKLLNDGSIWFPFMIGNRTQGEGRMRLVLLTRIRCCKPPQAGCNYGVTCEDEAKRRNSGAKMKTFEENSYQLPYAISSKEDMAYQRQLITSKRVCLIPNPAYHRSPIHRIQLVVSQRSAVNVIDGN